MIVGAVNSDMEATIPDLNIQVRDDGRVALSPIK